MIASVDPINRLIYLDADTVNTTIQPVDIYRELRALRQSDSTLRGYDMFLTMRGAEPKNHSGTKRTERYMVLLNGTYLVPYDTTHTITIDGTIISDAGLEGTECFNRTPLSIGVEVDINYIPKQVEVIIIETGVSGLTASESAQLANTASKDDVAQIPTAQDNANALLDTEL